MDLCLTSTGVGMRVNHMVPQNLTVVLDKDSNKSCLNYDEFRTQSTTKLGGSFMFQRK
jgi:hypothetical protein